MSAAIIEHPILGPIIGEKWEWRVQRRIDIPCTGFACAAISIRADNVEQRPTVASLQALEELINRPPEFRSEIAQAIFQAYNAEIRQDYLKLLGDGYDYGISAADVPAIDAPDEIWRVVTGLYSIWVYEDGSLIIDYSVTFDLEHELNVRLRGSTIENVWVE
jgi:hypothetical protein